MKRLALLSLIFCLFVPALYAVNDDGSASVPGKKLVVSDFSNGARGSITTQFASNNAFAGNTYDITALTTLTEITAFDVNWSTAGESLVLDCYFCVGTAQGNESNPGAWTNYATGAGIGAGLDVPAFCDISGNGQVFGPGLHGMTIFITNYAALIGSLRYTNGTYTYSNADIDPLVTHHGLGDPVFGGTAFYPRGVNMTMYYNAGPPPPLTVSPKEISAYFGGEFCFSLFGDGYGGSKYVLLGSATGISPPMILPGGNLLFLARDWFTDLALQAALAGGLGVLTDFIGKLDVDGLATAYLTLPGHCQLFEDLDLWFAWTTYGPFDFQSNTVMVTITGAPAATEEYLWDDGTSENALGWNSGGTAAWIHSFDSGAGDTIDQVCSTFGQAGSANGPSNGTAIDVWVWSDPNQDGEPSDGLVLGHGSGVVANTSTNDFNHYNLDMGTAVADLFFVGCSLEQAVGVFAAPMDQNNLGLGVSFFTGAYTGSPYGIWDAYNLGGFPIYAMGAIGFDSVWMLRANDP